MGLYRDIYGIELPQNYGYCLRGVKGLYWGMYSRDIYI